ncbi:MAG: hypothetical protein J6X27_00885, partial [Bacteroidaceae bacterium]|nr:hypothetical protein [Bacteroidaceae bacterium]
GRGSGETLQDYAGFSTVSNQYGYFPVMKSGESLKWIVRTNSAGTGFSLENKAGGTDYSNGSGGVSAPAFLNDFQGLGGLNYWITADNDAQNDVGSLLTVLQASGAVSTTVKWVLMDGSNPVYTLTQDVTAGQSINAYPTELTTMALQRFVTLPSLTPFTAGSGQTVKNVSYTWTGPFQISTAGNEHHYNLKMRSTRYLSSDTNSDGVLYMPDTAPAATDNAYRWMFFGDLFNGFTIRCYAKGSQELAAANGTATDGTSFPTFANEGEGTKWIVTSATRSGYTKPFSINPVNTSGVYWNQYSYWNNSTLSYGLKYWDHDGTGDAGACIEAVELPDLSTVYLTWNILDAAGNTKVTIEKEYAKNATVSEYPAEMAAYEDRFVAYPTLTSFTADRTKSVDVTYNWTGPFQLTTDTDNPHLYFFKSTRYSYYAYAPDSPTGQAKQASGTKNLVTPRGRWFFTGDPFNGIEIRPYAYPETGLVNSTLSTTPTKYIPKANPDITTNYWDNALPSAAVSFLIPNSSNCLAEQLGTWSAASINSDKGLSFVVEEAEDISMLIEPGYYQVRCMGSGLTTKYWKLDDQGGDKKLWNDGNPNDMNTVFRIEENINASNNLPESYYISGFYGDEVWYLDNTRTSYSQQFTATQTPENYMPAQIEYNAKADGIPYYAIKLSNQTDYSGYSYANTNSNGTTVVTWVKTDGTADGSAWTFEPAARVTLNAVGDKSYATFYFNRDVQTDENTKAYYITEVGSNHAQLTEVENEGHNIPAYTAVVLINSAQASSVLFHTMSGLSSVVEADDNLLKGTLTSMTLDLSDSSPYYSMGRLNGEIGFYKFNNNDTTITLGANKAYLQVPGQSGSKGFSLLFDDDITGIITQESRVESQESNIWYTLDGRKLSNKPSQSGIYIYNGKKIFVK